MDLADIISLIGNAVLIAIAIYATRQIVINQKQLHLSAIGNCVNLYRQIEGFYHDTENEKSVRSYLELVNEELFYFRHNYLPEEISNEWIDGMLDKLPLTCKENIINSEYCMKYFCNESKLENYLKAYPRIRHAFDINNAGAYNFNLLYSNATEDRKGRIKERKKIIKEIYGNIKKFEGFN